MNPLSDVMGGWGIWETVNGEQKLTTECIENVIMMMPVSIEMLQLLLRLGTFQLSDIFYNTVGGVLGGLMYCAVMKARKRL